MCSAILLRLYTDTDTEHNCRRKFAFACGRQLALCAVCDIQLVSPLKSAGATQFAINTHAQFNWLASMWRRRLKHCALYKTLSLFNSIGFRSFGVYASQRTHLAAI